MIVENCCHVSLLVLLNEFLVTCCVKDEDHVNNKIRFYFILEIFSRI